MYRKIVSGFSQNVRFRIMWPKDRIHRVGFVFPVDPHDSADEFSIKNRTQTV